MKKTWKIVILSLTIPLLLSFYFLSQPKDIRPVYVKKGLSKEDYQKGKQLLQLMEKAYGGKEKWQSYQQGHFIQTADWYERLKVSGWDTLPQRFKMTAYFGGDDCEMELLNGKNQGKRWAVYEGESYVVNANNERLSDPEKAYLKKMIFKNYWFQFPFRIGEAQTIAYAGEAAIKGKTYYKVFATWGKEEAHKEHDQFVLYLDKSTYYIHYLAFTARDVFKSVGLVSRFEGFEKVGGLTFPYHQYITTGTPESIGFALHENHYEQIWID